MVAKLVEKTPIIVTMVFGIHVVYTELTFHWGHCGNSDSPGWDRNTEEK